MTASMTLLNAQIISWKKHLDACEQLYGEINSLFQDPSEKSRIDLVLKLLFSTCFPVESQITKLRSTLSLAGVSSTSTLQQTLEGLTTRATLATEKLNEMVPLAWHNIVRSMESSDVASRVAKPIAVIISGDPTRDTAISLACQSLLQEDAPCADMLKGWEKHNAFLTQFNADLRTALQALQSDKDNLAKQIPVVRLMSLSPEAQDLSLLKRIQEIEQIWQSIASSVPTKATKVVESTSALCLSSLPDPEPSSVKLTKLLSRIEKIRGAIFLSHENTRRLIQEAEKMLFPTSQWGVVYTVYDDMRQWLRGAPSSSEQEKQEILGRAFQDLFK